MAQCDVTKGGHCDTNSTCMPGWTGADCKQPCAKGTYGKNCTLRCLVCDNHGCPCDAVSGACDMNCERAVVATSIKLSENLLLIPSFVGGAAVVLMILSLFLYVRRYMYQVDDQETLTDINEVSSFKRRYSQSPQVILGTYSREGAALHGLSMMSHLSQSSASLDRRRSSSGVDQIRLSGSPRKSSSIDRDLEFISMISEEDECEGASESGRGPKRTAHRKPAELAQVHQQRTTEAIQKQRTTEAIQQQRTTEAIQQQRSSEAIQQQRTTEANPLVPKWTCTPEIIL